MRYELILPIIAGIFFGVAAIFTKTALLPTQGFSITSLQDWKIFLFSLSFIGLAIFNILAIIFYWWSLRRGRVMIVSPVCTSFCILIAIVGAMILFNEQISVLKTIAITTIIIGTIILRK